MINIGYDFCNGGELYIPSNKIINIDINKKDTLLPIKYKLQNIYDSLFKKDVEYILKDKDIQIKFKNLIEDGDVNMFFDFCYGISRYIIQKTSDINYNK